jgi:GIY-YIG catalytic domain
MTNIYILALEHNKYYVGRTDFLNLRIDKHFNHDGSHWTVKYKPIKIKETFKNCDLFDEDKHTIKMMAIYGIENVRGGSFTKINLSKEEIQIIHKMINNSKDRCFKCFSDLHFCKDCPYDEVNFEMILLRNKIINHCQVFDLNRIERIEINILKTILIQADSLIFKNVTDKDINHLCHKINKSEIKGIKLISLSDNSINYVDFSIGMSVLLDRTLKAKS